MTPAPARREGIAHRLTIDLPRCYDDPDGRLHLRGAITNIGSDPILFLDGPPLHVAARWMVGADLERRDSGARAMPPTPIVAPGATAPFVLTLPSAALLEDCRGIEVSLIREDRWLCDLGVPPIIVAMSGHGPERIADPEPSMPETVAPPIPSPAPEAADIASATTQPAQSSLDLYREARLGASPQATLDDLWNCYRLLLNREADPGGFELFAQGVREGMAIDALVGLFVASEEFASRHGSPRQGAPVRARINGLDLYLAAPQTPAERHILATGAHKPHLAGAIASMLSENQFVLDVGAGFGEFTTLAARRVGSAGRVVALEPNPRQLRVLLANVTTHGFGNIDVLPFAAADGDGFVTLTRRGVIQTARDVSNDDLTSGIEVDIVYARTIDSFVPIEQRVDLVRVGLDGFDHRSMLGARATLSQWRPALFGEYAPGLLHEFSQIEPIHYLRFLRDCGYSQFTAVPRDHGPIDLGEAIDRLAEMPARLGVAAVDFFAR